MSKVRGALADRYRIERVLGEGGMATVYLAEDLKHHRNVAVKVMRPELSSTLGADRFLREVEIAASLSHPHILPMHDSGEADGLLYYVMPYVDGESLQAKLRREGQLSVEEAITITREVTEALGYAHQRGIIHRDIKPANILLSSGHALVADFGIARALGGSGETITGTGIAIGTPHYMSPEQATGGHQVDARTDLYAVGAVLYEMMAGEPPFTGPTAQAIISRSLTERPRSLVASRPGLPRELDTIVARSLAKTPADRYPNAKGMIDALRAVPDPTRSGAAVAVDEGPAPVLVWGLYTGVVAAMAAMIVLLRRNAPLPNWTLGLAGLLLLVGAAVVVVTERVNARRRAGEWPTGLYRFFRWRNAIGGGVAALGLWAAVATAAAGRDTSSVVRLAILPFENLGNASDAYFADGVTDELRGKLTGIPGFQVTARASSNQYRQSEKPLTQIGSELGVDYLLTATIRWEHTPDGKGKVEVVPELIDTRTGAATWQQRFNADATGIFQVQSAIASRVAVALGAALGSTDQVQLAERPTENVAAYDLWLKGRAIVGADPNSARTATGFYEQAVALDPNFVRAWAALASSLSLLYANGTPDPAVAARGKAAAERALALSGDRPWGHVAMANYLANVRKDQEGAYAEMLLALRTEPNDPILLRGVGAREYLLGRWADATTHLEQAWRLDPRAGSSIRNLRDLYRRTGRLDEALRLANDAVAIAPNDVATVQALAMVHLARGDLAEAQATITSAATGVSLPDLIAYYAVYQDLYWVLTQDQQDLLLRLPVSAYYDDPASRGLVFAQIYWARGDKRRAQLYGDSTVAALDQQLRGAPDDAQLRGLRGFALAYAGRGAEAIAEGQRAIQMLPYERDAVNGYYLVWLLARSYILLGEYEKAIDQLEIVARDPGYLQPGWLRIDPNLNPLRGNPRFEALLRH